MKLLFVTFHLVRWSPTRMQWSVIIACVRRSIGIRNANLLYDEASVSLSLFDPEHATDILIPNSLSWVTGEVWWTPPSDMESQFSVIQGWDLQYSAWPLLLRMRVIRSWFGPGTTKYKEWHAPLVFGCAIKEWSFRRFTYGNLVTTFTSSKQKDADDKTVPARASAPERARSIAVSSRNNASRVPVAIAVMKPHDPVYGRYSSLPSCSIGSSDGRCVQRAGTYSTSADDGGLLGVPRSRVRLSKLYPNHEWVSSDLPNTCLKASHLWSAYAFEWTFMHVCLSTHPV